MVIDSLFGYTEAKTTNIGENLRLLNPISTTVLLGWSKKGI